MTCRLDSITFDLIPLPLTCGNGNPNDGAANAAKGTGNGLCP